VMSYVIEAPQPGRRVQVSDVIYLGERAGVPYKFRPVCIRVTKVNPPQPNGLGMWISGYELDNRGQAVVARPEMYIPLAGVQWVDPASITRLFATRRTAGATAS
jgi:hypothetical protein